MSIVLEALEKAQKEKNKIEDTPVIQPPQRAGKPELQTKTAQGRKSRKIFYIFFIPAIYFIFAGWWLNFNNAIVYEGKAHNPPVSTISNSQIPTQPGFLLDTTPEKTVEINFPSINVTGVVWDSKDPIVLVNSKFLKKGDEIMGAKIIDIQLRKVKFLYKDKEFTVSVE